MMIFFCSTLVAVVSRFERDIVVDRRKMID